MCTHPMGAVCLITLPNAHCISHHYRVGSPIAQLHHSLIPVVRAGNLSTFQVLKVLAWTSLLRAVSEKVSFQKLTYQRLRTWKGEFKVNPWKAQTWLDRNLPVNVLPLILFPALD